ncbi:asparagine synthetase [Stemphylium lycopersici]|uniref:Asparagine synthetase n=1 Tax=Stemphylium lycopersici TaxID=183478 RepID=A0A364N1B9_STELY|nr:asparagine synthetase [Stemphylium lycopersici]
MEYPRPVSSTTFCFLDLPKDVRFIVYENLPRLITNVCHRNTPIDESASNLGDSGIPVDSIFADEPTMDLTLIQRSTSTAILRTCREIYAEAAPTIHRTIRRFILEATPKVASGLRDPSNAPVGTVMRAAACEYVHLRQRFGYAEDGSPTVIPPCAADIASGKSLYLAQRYCDYSSSGNGSQQYADPGSLIDYTAQTTLFLHHVAEARAKSAAWDYADVPLEGHEWKAEPVFLPGSAKAHSPWTFHRVQDHRRYHGSDSSTSTHANMADANTFTHSTIAWLTTSSLQLLYRHIQRHHRAEDTTPNPAIEFVHAYNPFAGPWTRLGNARSTQARSVLTCVAALTRSGRTALCADEGVDIRFRGWVCAPVKTEAEAVAEAVAVVKDTAAVVVAEAQAAAKAEASGSGSRSRSNTSATTARQIRRSVVPTLEPYSGNKLTFILLSFAPNPKRLGTPNARPIIISTPLLITTNHINTPLPRSRTSQQRITREFRAISLPEPPPPPLPTPVTRAPMARFVLDPATAAMSNDVDEGLRDADNGKAQRGHARAHYADVYLVDGPEDDVQLVPSDIFGAVEAYEGF